MPKGRKDVKVVAIASLPAAMHDLDWSLCCLCQSKDVVGLICPANNPNPELRNAGYISLGETLQDLRALEHILPSRMKVGNLDGGSGISQTLSENTAKYHQNCRSQYRGEKLSRLKKSLAVAAANAKDGHSSSGENSNTARVTRSSVPLVSPKSIKCFLCLEEGKWKAPLHSACTDKIIEKVRNCAHILQDSKLLATLSAGDIFVQELKYHLRCLQDLYNKCKVTESEPVTGVAMCEGMAFADLINFIQMKLDSESIEFIFKVPDLTTMYRNRLATLLGVPHEEIAQPQTTRFRKKILSYLPELHEIKSGKEYVLTRKSAYIHKEFVEEDHDGDALAFNRLMRNLRKEISKKVVKFEGGFDEKCQESSVPPTLLAVVKSLLYGTSGQSGCQSTGPALTISQLILFNFQKKDRAITSDTIRHKKDYEPPLPVYIGISLYGEFRTRKLIDRLHSLGISVSYDRIMEITSTFCHLAADRAKEEGVVCPEVLRKNMFTVAAIDNIDHNPSSTTSESSFHGTALSVFQLSNLQSQGEKRLLHTIFNTVQKSGRRSVPSLPDAFIVVPEYTLAQKQPPVPDCLCESSSFLTNPDNSNVFWREEENWLSYISGEFHLESQQPAVYKDVSWSAFHAARALERSPQQSIRAVLPLFDELSSSVSMLRHGMNLVQQLTVHLNEQQVPVLVADQPLYTTCKLIQWNWPDLYSEEKFVLLFAPFHIEQNFLRVLGQLLNDSGWITIIAISGVTTKGRAEAILKVSNVKRSRLFHEMTAAVLYSLMIESHEKYISDGGEGSLDEWLSLMSSQSPTFKYWLTVLNLEILLLTFVGSLREKKYDDFLRCIKEMIVWFFAFDHVNYSRWLSVHIKDLTELHVKSPYVHQQFCLGNFVVEKSGKPFSAIAIDQAHEQHNAEIKATGGANGLYQDLSSRRRVMLSAPEISRLVTAFENLSPSSPDKHHEQYSSFQRKFLERCLAVKDAFLSVGNPFEEQSGDLLCLDSKIVMQENSVNALNSAENAGRQAYETFVQERLILKSKPLYEPVKKIGTKIFDIKSRKSATSTEVKILKDEIQLFSRLFIVAKERELDLDKFFHYENQECPPSISLNGRLRPGKKAELAEKLETLVASAPRAPESFDSIIIDGPALVQNFRPRSGKTFEEYFKLDLKVNLSQRVTSTRAVRVDLVWDLYWPDSLKNSTREDRGCGLRRQVQPKCEIPRDWADFLRNSANKSALFEYLADSFISDFPAATVVTNQGEKIISSNNSLTSLAGIQVTQEEADGRIILHAKDMVEHGAQNILVQSSDTDVLVLCISFFFSLKELGLRELWILSGVGTKRRYIATHLIASALGEETSQALRGFHCYTGCDTTSFFNSIGKKKAFMTWMKHPNVTPALFELSNPQIEITEGTIKTLEEFTAVLYDPKTQEKSTTNVRKYLFCTKNKLVQFLPPTHSALQQHALRAAYHIQNT